MFAIRCHNLDTYAPSRLRVANRLPIVVVAVVPLPRPAKVLQSVEPLPLYIYVVLPSVHPSTLVPVGLSASDVRRVYDIIHHPGSAVKPYAGCNNIAFDQSFFGSFFETLGPAIIAVI